MKTQLLILMILTLAFSLKSYGNSNASSGLNNAISNLISTLEQKSQNEAYEPSHDSQMFNQIQTASGLLDHGANPNVYVPGSLNMFMYNFFDLNAFDASILVSGLVWRPKLVEAFLAHGASATAPDSSGLVPMDYAIFSFLRNQTDSVREIKSGLRIIRLLEAHGAKLSDAKRVQKAFGLPPNLNFANLAQTVLTLKVMYQLGLVSRHVLINASIGPAAARARLRNMTTLGRKFLENNGAHLRNLKADALDGREISRLIAPSFYSGKTHANLFVVEPVGHRDLSRKNYNGKHNDVTFSIATGTAKAINPKVDPSRIFAWGSRSIELYTDSSFLSTAMKLMLNLGGAPLQNRVVFSSSFGPNLTQGMASIVRQHTDGNSFDLQTALYFQKYLESGKPIVFQAAGNSYLEEGNYMNTIGITNGPRTVLVGAVARYPTADNVHHRFVVFPQSSVGADLCAPLPRMSKKLMLGTSCATPVAAALYRQFAEWYSSKLSYDEIIAAALLTAHKHILKFVDPYDAYNAILNGKSVADLKTQPATLGVRSQCGAGVINEIKWQQALNWMVKNKTESSPSVSEFLPLNKIRTGVYAVTLPKSLTLSRLTFFIPQARDQHSNIYVKMPAQPEIKLPLSATEVLSTFAFANQDVNAGDKITVYASEPLLSMAGIVVRGEPNGNVIQKFKNWQIR